MFFFLVALSICVAASVTNHELKSHENIYKSIYLLSRRFTRAIKIGDDRIIALRNRKGLAKLGNIFRARCERENRDLRAMGSEAARNEGTSRGSRLRRSNRARFRLTMRKNERLLAV